MNPRIVYQGLSNTGAAVVTDAYGFIEKEQAKQSLRENEAKKDAERLRIAKDKIGDEIHSDFNSVELDAWDAPSRERIGKRMDYLKQYAIDSHAQGHYPYKDPEFLRRRAELNDEVLFNREHKKNYKAALDVINTDRTKGDNSQFDYDKSIDKIEEYRLMSPKERAGLSPDFFFVPKEVNYSMMGLAKDAVIPYRTKKYEDDNVTSDRVTVDEGKLKTQAEAILRTPKGKATFDQGVANGEYVDEKGFVDAFVKLKKAQSKESSSYSNKSTKPRYTRKGRLTDEGRNLITPQTINFGSGSMSSSVQSKATIALDDLDISMPTGDVNLSKEKLGGSNIIGKFGTGDVKMKETENLILGKGTVFVDTDGKIKWKGVAKYRDGDDKEQTADVYINVENMNNESVNDAAEALRLYMKELEGSPKPQAYKAQTTKKGR